MENVNVSEIPAEKFQLVQNANISQDKKLETKPVGYFQDAFRRFCKNKGSVVAAIIVLILMLYALIGPFCVSSRYTDAYALDTDVVKYKNLLPKVFESGSGFWDGTDKQTGVNTSTYLRYSAIAQETGYETMYNVQERIENGRTVYDFRLDTYHTVDCFEKTLTASAYSKLIEDQENFGKQIIMPYVNENQAVMYVTNKNVWYVCDQRGTPVLTGGELTPAYHTYATNEGRRDDYPATAMRLPNDPYVNGDTANGWSYARRTGMEGNYNYVVRVNAYNYFTYKYGFEPKFAFGTEIHGYDIFSRLASGARFSLLFALAVSAVNLIIGAIYGAIEGYYGGTIDLVLERISDILSALPTMVITVLFNLHLSAKVGVVPALLYAFVLTGWIGMASRTRMQFYRFKNQEYVLTARTLGAKDRRIIWRHIFPNSLGTLITGSVLTIPSVIFSETSLSYLGIINLDSPSMSSVGSMLSSGQSLMVQYPHLILFPAIFIGLLMICFNLFGNGLRDAFNPSLRGAEG